MSDQFTYSKKVIKYFKNPKFAHEMKNPDAFAQLGNIRCGDVFKIFLKFKDGKVREITYLSYGCMAALAACESFCRLVKGKTIEEAKKIGYQDIKNDLGDLPEFKVHCTMMVVETFKKAMKNYKKKKE
ncbi:MAG: iron-sulfur cluster assembly scaffold protein [Nanoarchaeota archaeon]|nr:iron-sulfur cluster assembly scaffold protein [Nanoarchaeota archaeon]